MGKNKSQKLNLIICGCAFIIMILIMFLVDKPENIWNAVVAANPVFLLLAVLLIFIYWLLEGVGLHVVTKSIHSKQKFKDSLSVALIGQYFNCITPFASGGQPIQAYYLVKFGAPLSSALTGLLSKFIAYQFVLTIYCAVLLILRLPVVTDSAAISTLVIIGFVMNFAVICGLLMLAFFKKTAKKLAHFILRVCARLHIVKDLDAKIKYVDDEMEMYLKNFQFIKSQPMLIIKLMVITILQLTAYFSISFVIYLGFGLSGTDFITIVACQAFVLLISSFVPLPGALGAAEGSYLLFFGGIFAGFTSLSTFIWRFLTFYFAIIVGMITTLIVNKKTRNTQIAKEDMQEIEEMEGK